MITFGFKDAEGQVQKTKNSNALINSFYEIGWVDPFPFDFDLALTTSKKLQEKFKKEYEEKKERVL